MAKPKVDDKNITKIHLEDTFSLKLLAEKYSTSMAGLGLNWTLFYEAMSVRVLANAKKEQKIQKIFRPTLVPTKMNKGTSLLWFLFSRTKGPN